MESIIALLAVLIGLSVGAGAGFYGRRLVSARRINSAQVEADQIVEAARSEAQTLVIETKEETLQLRRRMGNGTERPQV